MWKVFVGFVAFALLALFVVMKGGNTIDMQGEAGAHAPAASEPAASAPVATTPAASAPAASK